MLEERRMRVDSDPAAQLGEEVLLHALQHHPYRTPIIGWEHEIEELNRDDAFAYYQRFYTPENAILVVAGDVDAAEVRALAEETYGADRRARRAAVRKRPAEPDPRACASRDPERSARAAALAQARLADADLYSGDRDEVFALEIVAEILGGGTTSRLYRKLCVEEELAAGANAYFMGSMVDRAAFQLSASPRPASRWPRSRRGSMLRSRPS